MESVIIVVSIAFAVVVIVVEIITYKRYKDKR